MWALCIIYIRLIDTFTGSSPTTTGTTSTPTTTSQSSTALTAGASSSSSDTAIGAAVGATLGALLLILIIFIVSGHRFLKIISSNRCRLSFCAASERPRRSPSITTMRITSRSCLASRAVRQRRAIVRVPRAMKWPRSQILQKYLELSRSRFGQPVCSIDSTRLHSAEELGSLSAAKRATHHPRT